MKKVVFKSFYTKDGYIGRDSGRIVIYDGVALTSRGGSVDHNDLLRSLARKYGFDKDKVISNAIRMYYTIEDDTIIISESRKIDYDDFHKKYNTNMEAVKKAFKI